MKFKIDNIEYQTPDSWDKITVGQFMKLESILRATEDAEDRKAGVVQVLCNIPDDVMPQCSLADVKHIYNNLDFVDSTEPTLDITHTFFIEGREFYFDVNFQKTMNNDMFRDAMSLLSDPLVNLDQILAMLIRPVTKRTYSYYKWKGINKQNYVDRIITVPYSGQLVEDNSPLMRNISISKAWGVACFFFQLSATLRAQVMERWYSRQPQPEAPPAVI